MFWYIFFSWDFRICVSKCCEHFGGLCTFFQGSAHLSVIKARFSCILVNFTCRFEDSPSVPERSYEQSVDILGYYYASISHVSTNYPLNFYTLSIDNSFMKVLKNAKSECQRCSTVFYLPNCPWEECSYNVLTLP